MYEVCVCRRGLGAGRCAGGALLLLVDVQAYDGRGLPVLIYVEIVLDAHGVANS